MLRNYRVQLGKDQLINALAQGDLALVQQLLEDDDVTVNSLLDEDERTPLHIAAAYGHEKLVKWLSDHNAKIDQETSDMYTALSYAVDGSHLAVVETLLGLNASADITLLNRQPILITAIDKKWKLPMIKQLLAAGAKVHETRPLGGEAALHIAVENNDEKLVTVLINAKADVNQVQESEYGDTPLELALRPHIYREPNLVIVQALLTAQADVNYGIPDTPRSLALKFLRHDEHPDIVKLIIAADVEQRGEQAKSELSPELCEIYENYQLEQLKDSKIPPEEFNNHDVIGDVNHNMDQ